MGRIDYLVVKTNQETAALLESDFDEPKIAVKKLVNHATKLGGVAFGTSFLRWIASFSAIPRDHWIGLAICLAIGCNLMQEHIQASGGFRNSFTQSHGISNTIGIILLLVFPMWALLTHVI